MTQLSEQISSLNERMEEFTNRIEELNSKLSCNRNSPSWSLQWLSSNFIFHFWSRQWLFDKFYNASFILILPISQGYYAINGRGESTSLVYEIWNFVVILLRNAEFAVYGATRYWLSHVDSVKWCINWIICAVWLEKAHQKKGHA